MRSVAVLVALTAGIVPAAGAQAAGTEQPTAPDITALLSEFYNWWTPKTVDTSSHDPSAPSSSWAEGVAFRGDSTAAGKSVLKANDEKTYTINHEAASSTAIVDGTHTQTQRAGIDADYNSFRQYKEVFGPTIAGYIEDGLNSGELPRTNELIFNEDSDLNVTNFGTGSAKTDFNYIRPYAKESIDGWDRTFGGENNLNGLAADLEITRIPTFTEGDEVFGETYADINDNPGGSPTTDFTPSQSFPSGHTARAYNLGINLAALLPELGTELITRASEGGNNRIVLGMHYTLDVIGSRIAASADATTLWSDDEFRENELLPAHEELEDYIASRCEADGLGDTVAACVKATGANAGEGYTNSYTDSISTNEPVTDRASAIRVYTQRMTYGFDRTSAAGQAPKVPEGASNLLLTVFPDLTDAQRTQVLAATEIDSGYPLDATSKGWARVNLAAVFSSKVTVDSNGNVIKVEPGQPVASVVLADNSGTDSDSGSDSDKSTLAETGASILPLVAVMVLLSAAGITAVKFSRRD